MTEEDLLRSGHGWCNEQARVLVALTQVAELPSRLVFAHSRDGKAGHVATEVYVDGKWVLVDQTEGLVFVRKDGSPLNVLDCIRWSCSNASGITTTLFTDERLQHGQADRRPNKGPCVKHSIGGRAEEIRAPPIQSL